MLDVSELRVLAGSQVLGVLPQREPRSLEVLGDLGLAGFSGLVPDLSADVVQRLGRELHDMERIDAALRVREPLGDRP